MRPPLYHDLIAEGVPEDKAMKWHNTIQTLMSHADHMSREIKKASQVGHWNTPIIMDDATKAAGFYEDWKTLS